MWVREVLCIFSVPVDTWSSNSRAQENPQSKKRNFHMFLKHETWWLPRRLMLFPKSATFDYLKTDRRLDGNKTKNGFPNALRCLVSNMCWRTDREFCCSRLRYWIQNHKKGCGKSCWFKMWDSRSCDWDSKSLGTRNLNHMKTYQCLVLSLFWLRKLFWWKFSWMRTDQRF